MKKKTETEEKEIKLRWFNSLPRVKMRHEPCEMESTCPCGETIWYASGPMTTDIESWLDIHYAHRNRTAPPKIRKPETVAERFDFTRRIRFSKAGFAGFAEEFALVKYEQSGCDAIFIDSEKRLFAFFQIYSEAAAVSDYEGVYMVFNPEKSRLEVNA